MRPPRDGEVSVLVANFTVNKMLVRVAAAAYCIARHFGLKSPMATIATSPVRGSSLLLLALAWASALPVHGAEWSVTEAHLQYGRLRIPTFAGGGEADTLTYTLQHASGWKYGDNFFFVDFADARDARLQNLDTYAEWFSNFSLGKISGRTIGRGIIADVGLIWGFGWAPDADVRKYLPGIRLGLNLEGFTLANLDISAYIDDNAGAAAGGAPRESDSYSAKFNFARPFTIGKSNFSIEGYVEYVSGRVNEFGDNVESWILAQPQFRWSPNDQVSLGIEYQFWLNKLGDGATDESAVQALLVWKF